MRQSRIEPLADGVVALGHILARLRLEAGVGADVIEELLQRAGKADLPLDRLHLALQPRDFGQPNAVDRVRRQVGGRAFRDAVRVERGAAGDVAQADAVAGARQIFGADEVAQAGQRRADLGRNAGAVGGAQPLLLAGGDGRRKRGQRSVEGAAFDALAQHRVELPQHIGHHQSRLNDARGQAFAHADDRTVDGADEVVGTLQAIVVVGDGFERRDALARTQFRKAGVNAVEVIERQHARGRQQRTRQPAQVGFALPAEDVVRDALGRAQTGAVDACERRELAPRRVTLGGIVIVGKIIAKPVGVAQVAARKRLRRIADEVGLVAGGEQSGQRLRW